ncbi:hypothetical protein FRB94_012219 [Tulasnella sp. JGI-2019a]|nr:hypothetical protein FRB94_012219 [Tulasnella sp. JGI-2019a]
MDQTFLLAYDNTLTLNFFFVQISSFSSLIAGAVLPSQQVTAPVQRLSMIAGTCIIVDICSWSFEGTPASGKSQAELLSALQHALISYQQQKKDLVIQSISQMPK